jgi:hypothetical protein
MREACEREVVGRRLSLGRRGSSSCDCSSSLGYSMAVIVEALHQEMSPGRSWSRDGFSSIEANCRGCNCAVSQASNWVVMRYILYKLKKLHAVR